MRNGVTADKLSKIWHISKKDTEKTIDITIQRYSCVENWTLTRNFSTNNRMLCYNRLEEHFFIDTFYATSKKGLKLTRSNTYY